MLRIGVLAGSVCLMSLVLGCSERPPARITDLGEPADMSADDGTTPPPDAAATDVATFGAGCFWCVEAVFQRLDGVTSVVSGYAGGRTPNPTYHEVCSGATGHAEVCQITYDPQKITFDDLLKVFWKTHDPTTLNRQGPDQGSQYRSVVFYHDEHQKERAEHLKQQLDESGAFPAPIVTEISPLTIFYKAEGYHQDFYDQNRGHGYCQMWIRPKLDKFEAAFGDKLKKSAP